MLMRLYYSQQLETTFYKVCDIPLYITFNVKLGINISGFTASYLYEFVYVMRRRKKCANLVICLQGTWIKSSIFAVKHQNTSENYVLCLILHVRLCYLGSVPAIQRCLRFFCYFLPNGTGSSSVDICR